MDERVKKHFRSGDLRCFSLARGKTVQVATEAVIATIDHSDIYGFGYPHGHHPSGAASH
jgi:hypothetical protein